MAFTANAARMRHDLAHFTALDAMRADFMRSCLGADMQLRLGSLSARSCLVLRRSQVWLVKLRCGFPTFFFRHAIR